MRTIEDALQEARAPKAAWDDLRRLYDERDKLIADNEMLRADLEMACAQCGGDRDKCEIRTLASRLRDAEEALRLGASVECVRGPDYRCRNTGFASCPQCAARAYFARHAADQSPNKVPFPPRAADVRNNSEPEDLRLDGAGVLGSGGKAASARLDGGERPTSSSTDAREEMVCCVQERADLQLRAEIAEQESRSLLALLAAKEPPECETCGVTGHDGDEHCKSCSSLVLATPVVAQPESQAKCGHCDGTGGTICGDNHCPNDVCRPCRACSGTGLAETAK